jgi:Cerato-platanin
VIFYIPAIHKTNTMIYFTSFIFTLLLSHVARAVPACGDVASPQELYNSKQSFVPIIYTVTWDATYDNPNGNTDTVACSNGPNGLDGKYPQFHDFPDFPYLGGAFNVKWGSPNCGQCWKLTDTQTGRWIYFTAIDAAGNGFNIGQKAFIALNGGTVGQGTLEAEAIPVAGHFCGF